MISTKGRYAIRLLIDLAEQNSSTPVPLDAIANRQEISKKYLEAIVKVLVTGKLVKGTSGKGGGYFLTRSPEEYTIWEILELTEGNLSVVSCLGKNAEPCSREGYCQTLPMWKEYNDLIRDFFSKRTIADLINSDPEEILNRFDPMI